MAVRDLTARNAIEDRLWVRIYSFIFIYFFPVEFFQGVSRCGPYRWSTDRSVRRSVDRSVGLVHGPGLSVFGSPSQECHTRHLKSIAEMYQLSQLINTPTRVTATSCTLIDLVFTNSPNKIVSSGVLHSGLSNHYPVYMVRKISASFPRSHKYVTSRNYSKFDSLKFRNELSTLSWDTLNNYSDPESMWQAWKNMFLSVADQHAPVKTKRVRRTASPWLTHEIKLLIIKRDRTRLSARNSNDPKLWSDYKSLRNQVNRESKEFKKVLLHR